METTKINNILKMDEQESYIPLAEKIIRNGFIYDLVERNDYKALYSQRYKGSDYIIAHEIFYIVKEYRKKAPGIEEMVLVEAFPSNSEFGRRLGF